MKVLYSVFSTVLEYIIFDGLFHFSFFFSCTAQFSLVLGQVYPAALLQILTAGFPSFCFFSSFAPAYPMLFVSCLTVCGERLDPKQGFICFSCGCPRMQPCFYTSSRLGFWPFEEPFPASARTFCSRMFLQPFSTLKNIVFKVKAFSKC